MQPRRLSNFPGSVLAALSLAVLFLFGCSTNARSTELRGTSSPEDYQADEFIGTPIMGDYDNNPDLDFVLQVTDGDRVFKIDVHESAGEGNRELLERVRSKINDMEDHATLRVIGYYNPEYKGASKEYGHLDLKCIIFFSDQNGQEEAYFTDPKDSRFYESGDVTIIYAPGQHYNSVYYPRFCSPWWDYDGDGIPNRYDPWPYTYDLWYDYNLNYIPDWYDPFYCDYYPYWSNWDMGFWVGYGWYSPGFYRHGYSTGGYYDDFRTYTRLYDREESSRFSPNYRLDVKQEARYRGTAYSDSPRATSATDGSRYRGYDTRPVDSRRLNPVAPTDVATDLGALDVRLRDADPGGSSGSPVDFNRNRAATNATGGTNRDRTVGTTEVTSVKRKATSSSATGESPQAVNRSRTAPTARADRDLSRSRSAGEDERAFIPNSSRSRETTSESEGSGTSSSGNYRGAPTRERGGQSGEARPSSSNVSRSREGSSSQPRPSATTPSGSSRSRPAPAANPPSHSSGGSKPAPAARTSGDSSRSRSGSSSSGSSSSGGERRRR